MTQVHYTMPPELTEHAASRSLGPCLICLMMAKGDQVTRTRDIWQPLVNDGQEGKPKWIAYAEKADIREAVIVGINDFFPGVLLPLCWDHLGAIAPPDPAKPCSWCNGTGRAKGIEAARGPLPPGLANGGKRGRG